MLSRFRRAKKLNHRLVQGRAGCIIYSFQILFIAICADGTCYKYYFDPRKGGECTRESFERFLKD